MLKLIIIIRILRSVFHWGFVTITSDLFSLCDFSDFFLTLCHCYLACSLAVGDRKAPFMFVTMLFEQTIHEKLYIVPSSKLHICKGKRESWQLKTYIQN